MKCFWVKKLAHKGCPCLCGGGVGQFKSAPEPEDSVRDSSVRSLCPILCPPPNSTKRYELSHASLESLAGHGISSPWSQFVALRPSCWFFGRQRLRARRSGVRISQGAPFLGNVHDCFLSI